MERRLRVELQGLLIQQAAGDENPATGEVWIRQEEYQKSMKITEPERRAFKEGGVSLIPCC